MTTIEIVLWVIKIISIIMTVIFGIFGIYEFWAGREGAAKLLKRLNLPFSYAQVLIMAFIFLELLFISNILLAKLSGQL